MWQITGVTTPNGESVQIEGGYGDDRKSRTLGDRLGPGGARYTLTVGDLGTCTLEDVGASPVPGGDYAVRLNDADRYWTYSGEGHAAIAVDTRGRISINGADMNIALTPDGHAVPPAPSQLNNSDYLAAARRFAPVVTFYRDGDSGSEEPYYPCSIDFLLARSTLRRGEHDYTGYNTNRWTPPGVARFKDTLHIFFQDHNGNGLMHVASPDGLGGWGRPASWYHGANTSAGPSAVEFQGKLHLFYRDATGNGIYHEVSTTGDDWTWVGYFGLDCDGQPKVIATPTCLYLVAVDAGGNGIMYAKSTDGVNFSHEYTGYNTNSATPPGVAWFDGQFHLFFQDHNGNGLMHITSPSGEGRSWSRPASWYHGVNTSAGPEAVAAGGKLHLFFRDATGNGVYHQTSTNGDDWGPATWIDLDCDGQPQAIAVGDDVFLAAVDAGGNGIMYALLSDFAIAHPRQEDLAAHKAGGYHLDIEEAAYPGQIDGEEIAAPMYFTVQTAADHSYVDITYVMLYAFQGGQPCRAHTPFTDFNCIVWDYGRHQGDLEWVTVRLDRNLSAIQSVGYACHGSIEADHGGGWWPTDPDPARGGATYLREGERPIVRVTRNGHSCRNGWNTGSDIGWVTTTGAVVVDILDLFSNLDSCPTWRPFDPGHPGGLVPLGLTADGQPVNEPWALFAGRIGRLERNSYKYATYVNGSSVSGANKAFVDTVAWGGSTFGVLSAEVVDGAGPWGPGSRDFVQNSALTPMPELATATPAPLPSVPQQAVPRQPASRATASRAAPR